MLHLSLRHLHFILHTSYFILHITMHCMVETQYAAAGCGSTASLLYTALHTSYHHALHGGDAVRHSRLRLDCVSTLYCTSYFISPCIAW
jgi:hypothetical protein